MASNPPQSAWLGERSDDGNPSVSFSKELGRLHVTGKAYWHGPPGTAAWPSIHEGRIDGSATRLGYRANYDDGACEVAFTLLEPFLIGG
jgi:hypothetical protein